MSVHSPQGAPPPPPPGPPPGYPGPPTAKKGLGPLAWVGIGCGVLLVLAVIAVVATGIFVKNKVDEVVDIGEDGVKVKTDEGTVDVGAGGVTVTDAEGRVSTLGGATGDLPGWVPAYPNAGSPEGVFASENPEGKSATFTVSTADPIDQVLTFYKDKLEEGGFTTSKNTYGSGDSTTGTVTGTSADEKRTVNVLASRDGGQTQAVVTYSEKP
jgi:hypothetical protein